MESYKPIYLDHAATSGLRPESVYIAVDRQLRMIGGAALRGNHHAADSANQVVAQCRQALARLISAPDARSIALTSGCTQSLNLALHGLLRRGMHVVTTAAEHNSVLRPLEFLRQKISIRVTVVPVSADGSVNADDVLNAIETDTKLVAVSYASNVTGGVNDIRRLGQELGQRDIWFLCDGAQAIGYVPLDVQALNVDLLAIPGHKGVMGPLGTGALYVHPRVQAELVPLVQGGTGTFSRSLEMPDEFPGKLEAGNINVPGIAGLTAGVEYLLEKGGRSAMWKDGLRQLVEGLTAIDSVHVYGSSSGGCDTQERLPVVSFSLDGWSPQDVAGVLEGSFKISVRAGLHCAPLIHEFLGSLPAGTVRMSLGHFTTMAEIDRAVYAVREIAAHA